MAVGSGGLQGEGTGDGGGVCLTVCATLLQGEVERERPKPGTGKDLLKEKEQWRVACDEVGAGGAGGGRDWSVGST